jgi:WD40 repeat protein
MLDIATGKLRPLLPESKDGIHHLALSVDGKILVTTVGDTIRVLQMPTGEELRQFKHGQGQINAVAFSPDGKTLASAGGEFEKSAELKLWNLAKGKEIRTLEGHTSDVLAVAFSRDGKKLASGSRDQTARLWDVGTGKELRRLEGWEREVSSVAFSPDGKILAAYGEDRQQRIRLSEVATGKELPQFKGNTLSGQCLLFSQDGKTLILGGYEKIHILDLASGNEVGQVGQEHQSWIVSLALSADGKLLAAAACDNTLSLWDTTTWNDLYRFKGHQGEVGAVAYSRDGKLIEHLRLDSL